MKSRLIHIALPILVIGVGVVAAAVLVRSKGDAERVEREVIPPLVRVMTATSEDRVVLVSSYGSVQPSTQTQLVAEVAGRVVQVGRAFENGGFFKSGEVLLKLEGRDYELGVAASEAGLASSLLRLAEERAQGEMARAEWRELGVGEADDLVQRIPQLADAQARVKAAEAQLEKARLDLDRTELRAPYAGRVRQKMADVGGFVNRGQVVASIHSVAAAEVRLPVTDSDLAFLDVPLGPQAGEGPPVRISAEVGGQRVFWRGRIVRSEAEIDRESRVLHLIARIDDPFGLKPDAPPPLTLGRFVDAEIAGSRLVDIVAVPREALRGDHQVYVVDVERRLRVRDVDVVRLTRDEALVRSGIRAGEQVCLSPLEVAIDGMSVRIAPEQVASESVGGSL